MTTWFKNPLKRTVMAAAIGAALLAGGAAQAAAINISALTPGSIGFGACDFERGMSINGVAMGRCGVGAGGSTLLSTSSINFDGTWFTPGTSGGVGPVTVYFTSLADPTQYTSVLNYTITEVGSDSRIVGSFSTAWGSVLGLVPMGGVTVASGTPYDFGFAFMGARVETIAVSAPGTAALAGLGLLAAAGLARRRSA